MFFYSPHIAWQLIDDTVYISNEIDSSFYALDNISKVVWLMIGEGKTINDIIINISSTYNIDNKIVEDDVLDLLTSLKELGVISNV